MLFETKEFTRFATPQAITVKLTERLPVSIHAPCEVNCLITITRVGNYYLMNLDTRAPLTIECQRCLASFDYDYHRVDEIALCFNDERANELMEHYDAVVLDNHSFNLIDIITDNLHLYALWAHENDC